MDLMPKLRVLADAWAAAHQRTDPAVSIKTLGVRAAGNSRLFDRPQMQVDTYEKVVLYLATDTNWPAAVIPTDALTLLSALGVGDKVEAFEPRAAA